MFGNKLAPHQHVQRAARRVALTWMRDRARAEVDRARMEVLQLRARYQALGLADDEIPGVRRALGIVLSRERIVALAEVELANA
jgi:hypothetical protein